MRLVNKRIARAGVIYFALVFAAGFDLGTIRTLWIVPRVGTRMPELMEAPLMLVITIVSARWIIPHLAVPARSSARLRMGAIALGLLLIAEFGLVSRVRGISIKEYLANRDPAAGTIYYAMLGLFALMPLLVAKGDPTGERRE